MPIAERILELRTQQNLTQENLAEICNVSRQAVTKWENNEGIPKIDNLIELADIFNVSLDYLLRGKEIVAEHQEGLNKIEIDKTLNQDENILCVYFDGEEKVYERKQRRKINNT